MTKLLEEAFQAASQLPEAEQNALAATLLADLASEQRWATAFDAGVDFLVSMADEALEEHRSGRTKPLDPRRL